MPAAAGPGEGLVNCPGVGVDEAVDTGFHPGLVPTLDKGHGIGLGAAHGVEHQPLRREGTAGTVAVVLGEIGLVYCERHVCASSLRMGDRCPLIFSDS